MDANSPGIDIDRKYVRLVERRADGLVEFEFAIGEPDLCVEMLLPAEAYEQFCAANRVIRLDPRDAAPVADEAEGWNWNMRQATQQRFR
ncbi:phenol hydroxylase subunit [Aromatoleum toluclasticum]|uniref:phenol hydroxylase subunit n=1 Tax=Aromatoleum toluclasticum TaxID=92003 RepID=UPI000379017D|nr:phenol hydroxylase subunit [Aromatoleum toluclasticum]